MAKVTSYQQGQLASSQVGTPGVNHASASMLSGIAQGFEQLGAAQYQEHLAEKRQAEAELRATQKHMDDMARRVRVTNTTSGIEVGMQQTLNELQEKYRDQPNAALPEFTQVAQQGIQDQLENIDDPEERMMVQEKATEIFTGHLKTLPTWQRTQDTANAKKYLKNAAGSLSVQAGLITDVGELKKLEDKYRVQNTGFHKYYDDDGEYGVTKAISDASMAFLNGKANTGKPAELEQAINELSGTTYVEQDKLNQAVAHLHGIASYQQTQANLAQTQSDQAHYLDLNKRIIEEPDPIKQQEILNAGGKNVTPAHHASLQAGISRDLMKRKADEAETAALAKLSEASPTGDYADAPPEVIKQRLEDPNLDPEVRQRLSLLLNKTTRKEVLKQADMKLASSVGESARNVGKLGVMINEQITGLSKLRGAENIAAGAVRLQQNVNRYANAYTALSKLAGTVKDPLTKQTVDLEVGRAKIKYDQIMARMNTDPKGEAISLSAQFKNSKVIIETQDAMDTLYTKVTPKDIYTKDPNKQRYFMYFYNLHFYNQIQKHGAKATPAAITAVGNNPTELKNLRSVLWNAAAKDMHDRGFNP